MILSARLVPLILLLLSVLSCALGVPVRVTASTNALQFQQLSSTGTADPIEALYTGQYLLKAAGTEARLTGGVLYIGANDQHQLSGEVQFYGNSTVDYQFSWTGLLGHFRITNQQATVDILGPAGKALLAHMIMTRSSRGDLTGQIMVLQSRFPLSWRKIANAGAATAAATPQSLCNIFAGCNR
jgi:hypothetical protein